MTWPTFLSPWWGLLGLLAIPIIALYILRQKRPDMPISSTLLWSKALADSRASTPFQKLRRNLLLLLQLLILAALVITLMRPVVQTDAAPSVAGVIILDASASMQSMDGDEVGTVSRLDAAKAQAKALVEGMRPGDKYVLIVDGGGTSRATMDFTASQADLRAKIEAVRATDTHSDLADSLVLAAEKLKGLAGRTPDTEAVTAGQIYLFTDGSGVRLPNVPELQARIHYVRMGRSSENVGIVRLAVTAVPKKKDMYEVFAGLMNTSEKPRTVTVGLALGEPNKFMKDQIKQVTLGPRSQGGVIFENVVAQPGRLLVQVAGRDADVLPLDNTAYALLEAPRAVRVTLVTGGNPILEGFLKTAASLGVVDAGQSRILAPGAYAANLPADLVILDGVAPAELPRTDTLLIRPAASTGPFRIVGEMQRPPVLRWKRDDPAMLHAELSDLLVLKAAKLKRDAEFKELVSSTEGPLVVAVDRGSARYTYVGFSPTAESNWWQHPSLLVFLTNLVEQTKARHFIGMPQLITTGQAAMLWDVGESATVVLPAGTEVEVASREGTAEFAVTDRVGFYGVKSGGKTGSFAVNLLNPLESNVTPGALQMPGGGNLVESESIASVNREIWPWIVLAGLAVLLVEWVVYHRRLA